jgi:PAS domain S-box-containing protein
VDYRPLFRGVPSAILLLTPDLLIVDATEAYLKVSTARREEIVGHPLFDVFHDNPDDSARTGVRNLRSSLERVLRERVPDVMAVQRHDVRRRGKGGEFEERYWSLVNVPVLGPDGEVLFIIHRVDEATELAHVAADRSHDGDGSQLAAEITRRALELEEANRQLQIANAALVIARDQARAVEEESSLLRTLALRIGAAPDLRSALEVMLREVCRAMGWTASELWIPGKATSTLVQAASYSAGGEEVTRFQVGSAELSLAPGEELIGTVWQERRAVLHPEVGGHLSARRAALAEAAGLRTGAAAPVLAGDEIIAVMAYYHTEVRPQDAHLTKTLTHVAAELGYVIERKRDHAALHELNREIAERDRLLTVAGRVARLGGWTIDLTDKIVHWSDEVCAIHETPPGTKVTLEEGINDFTPEARPVIAEHVRACAEEGIPYDIELEKMTRKGRRVWVRTIGEAVRSADGTITHIQGAFQDITEMRAAETQRAAAAAHYRRLVETSPDGIVALDLEGHFTEVNPAAAELAGRPAGTLLGRHLAEVVAPEDLAEMTQLRSELLSTGHDVLDHELHIARPSGERRLVRLRTTVIRESGEVIGTHGIVRDITDERARELQLRRAERLASVGTLIGGVAHELNNPLHAIRNFAELLMMEGRGKDDHEALEIIQREADRAAKVVSDLRLLARESQEVEGGRVAVDLNDVVRHALKLRRYALSTRNIEVREDLADDLPPVLADRGNIEQVVLNLVVNAEQAMAEQLGERRLILRTRRTPGGAALHIVDSGPGIPAQHLERIFDPFFTTKAPGEGTGLGLSLVHNIVTEHGGAIHVDSQVGKGTAFRVELPLAPGEKAGVAEGAAAATGRVLRVLVVDDEVAVRRVSVRFLEHLGHAVETASDGAEALDLLASREYDVIVCDLRMPGLSGEEFLQRLREDERGLERRLIFVTGDTASTDPARLVANAGVPVLVKPVRLQELARVIEYAAGAGGPDRGREPNRPGSP